MKTIQTGTHVVVKVGGSLFRQRESFQRVVDWLNSHSGLSLAIVCGGGQLADAVRELDAELGLGESLAHELAIQAMRLNQQVLASRFGNPLIASTIEEIKACSVGNGPVFFDIAQWQLTASLGPPTWETTSDSIAAALAVESGAEELVLLKSAGPDESESPAAVFGSALVDREFANWTARLPAVRIVDLGRLQGQDWNWSCKSCSQGGMEPVSRDSST